MSSNQPEGPPSSPPRPQQPLTTPKEASPQREPPADSTHEAAPAPTSAPPAAKPTIPALVGLRETILKMTSDSLRNQQQQQQQQQTSPSSVANDPALIAAATAAIKRQSEANAAAAAAGVTTTSSPPQQQSSIPGFAGAPGAVMGPRGAAGGMLPSQQAAAAAMQGMAPAPYGPYGAGPMAPFGGPAGNPAVMMQQPPQQQQPGAYYGMPAMPATAQGMRAFGGGMMPGMLPADFAKLAAAGGRGMVPAGYPPGLMPPGMFPPGVSGAPDTKPPAVPTSTDSTATPEAGAAATSSSEATPSGETPAGAGTEGGSGEGESKPEGMKMEDGGAAAAAKLQLQQQQQQIMMGMNPAAYGTMAAAQQGPMGGGTAGYYGMPGMGMPGAGPGAGMSPQQQQAAAAAALQQQQFMMQMTQHYMKQQHSVAAQQAQQQVQAQQQMLAARQQVHQMAAFNPALVAMSGGAGGPPPMGSLPQMGAPGAPSGGVPQQQPSSPSTSPQAAPSSPPTQPKPASLAGEMLLGPSVTSQREPIVSAPSQWIRGPSSTSNAPNAMASFQPTNIGVPRGPMGAVKSEENKHDTGSTPTPLSPGRVTIQHPVISSASKLPTPTPPANLAHAAPGLPIMHPSTKSESIGTTLSTRPPMTDTVAVAPVAVTTTPGGPVDQDQASDAESREGSVALDAPVAVYKVPCSCGSCNQPDNDDMVQCDGCRKWYHYDCQEFDPRTPETTRWFCENCDYFRDPIGYNERKPLKKKGAPPGPTGGPASGTKRRRSSRLDD